jgi:hypothetical protein
VVLTPLVVVKELWRLIKAHPEMTHGPALVKLLTPGLLGMVCSFVAGYLALKLLSRLLEAGRWKYFGYYCLVASAVVFGLAYAEKTNSPSPVTNVAAPAPTAIIAPGAPTANSGMTGTGTMPDFTETNYGGVVAPATNTAPVAPITNAESAPIAPGTAVQ